MNSGRLKKSILNVVSGVGSQCLVIVLKFITRTVFVYTLGKAYLGINGLFADILTMLSLTDLGMDAAMNYRLYKPLAEKDEKRVRILMKFYKQAYRVVGIAILLMGITLIPFLRFLIKDYDSLEVLGINAILIFCLYLLQSVSSYLFFAYKSAVVRADQREYILNAMECIITLVTNIVQIVVLIVWKNFVVYTSIVILFTIIKNLGDAVIANKIYPAFFTKEEDSLDKEEIALLLKDCGALFVYRVNGVVLSATDNLVLSKFIGLVMVGMYSNYLMIFTTIQNLLNRIYQSCRASLGNLFATSDVSKNYFFFEIMNFITVLLYGTAGIGVVVLSNEFIELWLGQDFLIPQPFPILLGLEVLLAGARMHLGQIRNITGAFRQAWYRPIIGAVMNFVVSVMLVQKMGIYGVLIGTIVADIMTVLTVEPFIIYRISFNNYKPVRCYYQKNILYLMVLICVGILDYYICSTLLVNKGIVSLIFHIFICAISVPAVCLGIYCRTEAGQYIIEKGRVIFQKLLKR